MALQTQLADQPTPEENLEDSLRKLTQVDSNYNALVGKRGVSTDVLNDRAALFDAVRDNQENQAILDAIDKRKIDFESNLKEELLYAKIAKVFKENEPYPSQITHQFTDAILEFLEKYPDTKRFVGQRLSTDVLKSNANVLKGMTRLREEVAQLPAASEELKQLGRTLSQLFAVLGEAASIPNFHFDVQNLVDNLNAGWPMYTKDNVRLASTEWLQSNDYGTDGQDSRFPELNALNLWLLSATSLDLPDHETLIGWVKSAKNHFGNMKALGFLMVALFSLLAVPQLSPNKTWAAVRLLEFFVILDKKNVLTAKLLGLYAIIEEKVDTDHPIPLILCMWIKHQLERDPLTRGECLALFFKDHLDTIDLGDGIQAFQIAGTPDVFITDPADKIFRCSLEDIDFDVTDDLDLVLIFKRYRRRAVMHAQDGARIERAFPDLRARNRIEQ